MQSTRSKSGPIIYNLFPLLAGPVQEWSKHLPRIRDMGFDYVYVNPFHLTGASGSLYAIKDTDRLDPRFQNAPDDDIRVIQAFDEEARRYGLAVMIDLVINHAARDSVLVDSRPEFFAREMDGELTTPFAIALEVEGGKVFWRDLATFNYAEAEVRPRLIDHWDAYIAKVQALGVTAFRCDAAQLVPGEVWRELISRAKARHPDSLFVAETLGVTLETLAATAELGFDYTMSSFCFLDYDHPYTLEEYETVRAIAPAIAFPESHDTPRFAAKFDEGDGDRISRELVARYLLASSFAAGVMMPMGFEWGYRRQLHVVTTTPDDLETTGIDVSVQIAGANRLRRQLAPLNVGGEQRRLGKEDDPVVCLLRGDQVDFERSRQFTLAATNISAHPAPFLAATVIEECGLFDWIDVTPGRERTTLAPDAKLTFGPGEVRLFATTSDGAPHLVAHS